MKHILHAGFATSVAAAFLAVLAGCSRQPAERAPAVPPVKIFKLPAADEVPFRSFPGEVTARDDVRLSFDVGGRLIEFPVYDGQVVEAGDLIGQLDQSDFRAALDAAQTTFNTAQKEFDRMRQLRQRNVIAQSELDRQREVFERAEASLRTARKAFEDTRLVAPIKGRVSRRFVRNFQNVQAREPVVLLQNIAELEVEVQVPEALVARAERNITAEGADRLVEAEAGFAALPGERFPLRLRSFATQANPSSRTFPVSFLLNPPGQSNILPGMTCTVSLRFRNPDGTPVAQPGLYQIPVRALATEAGQPSVWRWDPGTGRVARVPVEMVALTGDSVQIRSADLRAGDEIVASGVRFLSEGMAVRRLVTHKP